MMKQLLLLLAALFISTYAISTRDIAELNSLQGLQITYEEDSESSRLRRSSLNQPFPDSVKVRFTAKGKAFSFDLEITRGLVEDAEFVIYGENEKVVSRDKPESAVYRPRGGAMANFLLRSDGLIQGIFVDPEDGELYNVEPLHLHEGALSERDRRALAGQSDMVVYADSSLSLGEDAQCGVASLTRNARGEEVMNVTSHAHGAVSGRQLLTVDRWTSCFPNDAVTRKMTLAMASDYGYYKKFKSSVTEVKNSFLSILSSSNVIYQTQVNVFLALGVTNIQTAAGGLAWNGDGPKAASCGASINAQLDAFTSWRASQVNEEDGLYHLMTDCWPPPGTVGLAWVGVLCSKRNGAGVSTYSSSTWKTVAHEVGHNFGANHAFQEGQGTTGGIMDYGNGLYNGEYQFNSKYNKDEVCKQITTSMSLRASSTVVANCWKSYQTECGNGIIEAGEDCDDTSSCCVGCKLKAGATCSGGECCDNCVEAPTTKNCGTQGYCTKGGVCTTSVCAQYSNIVFDKVPASNACQQQCIYNGQAYFLNSFGLDGAVQDGSICSFSPYSTCKTGKCVATTAPSTGPTTPPPTTSPPVTYVWSTGSWDTCTKSCGGGTQGRTVTCKSTTGALAPDANCPGTKPATSQACNTQACPASTSWTSGSWGACSQTCGGGTQTRDVRCVDTAGTPVADSQCAGTKPATSQDCNNQACTYSWRSGAWGPCTVVCNGGTTVRAVDCVDGSQTKVDDSLCAGSGPKPITQDYCNTQICGVWVAGSWSDCTKSCGSGTQTRSLVCNRPGTTTQIDESQCTAAKPATSQACNTQACSYVWVYTVTGACNAKCDQQGTETLKVWCAEQKATSVAVPDSNCGGSKPASTRACTGAPCDNSWDPASGGWIVSPWSACTPACGTGTQTRTVECKYKGYDWYCKYMSNNRVPESSRSCTGPACAIQWAVTQNAWTTCTAECGIGIQSRVLQCSDGTQVVDISQCSALSKPTVETRPCFEKPCGVATGPTWVVTDEWDECSASCEEEGIRTRIWYCVDVDGTRLPDASCPGGMPQNVIQPCYNTCEEVKNENGGLSTGAIVGIAVGVIAAALIVSAVILGVVLYTKRTPYHGKAPTVSAQELAPGTGQSNNPLYAD